MKGSLEPSSDSGIMDVTWWNAQQRGCDILLWLWYPHLFPFVHILKSVTSDVMLMDNLWLPSQLLPFGPRRNFCSFSVCGILADSLPAALNATGRGLGWDKGWRDGPLPRRSSQERYSVCQDFRTYFGWWNVLSKRGLANGKWETFASGLKQMEMYLCGIACLSIFAWIVGLWEIPNDTWSSWWWRIVEW